MNEERHGRKVVMFLLSFGIILGCGFFGYKWWNEHNLDKQREADTSYKVVTARNKSYDGVYSLTKEDEHGNNTWDGLMMYVKDDKIIDCSLIDRMTLDEFKEKYPHAQNAKTIEEAYETAWDDLEADYDFKWEDRYYKMADGYDYPQGGNMSYSGIIKNGINGKVNFCAYHNSKVNLETDYEFLNDMKLVPGYDEKSGEIWLSKLLKNEQSEYHEGYRLIKYNNASEIDEKCKISIGSNMDALNKAFNAGLSEY